MQLRLAVTLAEPVKRRNSSDPRRAGQPAARRAPTHASELTHDAGRGAVTAGCRRSAATAG
eukprot:2725373-Alexandrium_andersonii.AAC.1